MEKNQPSENHDERAPCEEVLGPDVANDQRHDSSEEHDKPNPASLRHHGDQVASAPPDQEAAEQGNQESVGVIGVVPPLGDEVAKNAPVEPAHNQAHDADPEPGPR